MNWEIFYLKWKETAIMANVVCFITNTDHVHDLAKQALHPPVPNLHIRHIDWPKAVELT